jgi:hypothetical protein
MNTMKLLACTVALIGATAAFGQDATARAKTRTAQLTAELGLNEQQAAKLQDLLISVEEQVAPERAKCAELQASIDGKMRESYTNLKGVLTPEQLAKLKSMPASSCDGVSGCTHGAKAAAGCAKDGAGAKAACCAGKAGAHASAPATGAEPMKTSIAR